MIFLNGYISVPKVVGVEWVFKHWLLVKAGV